MAHEKAYPRKICGYEKGTKITSSLNEAGAAGGRWQTQSTANQRKVTFNHRRILTLKCLGDYNWVMNLKKKT